MGDPLVVFIPEKDREALKGGGVLPPGWFRDAGEMSAGEGGGRVWLWTQTPEDADPAAPEGPPHPGVLLGLPCATDSDRRLAERRVAKLFGAWVVHVVFLDGDPGTDPGKVGVAPLLKRAEWVVRLTESIRYWFAEEQVRNIHHVAVVVARGGPVCLSEDEFGKIQKAMGLEDGESGKTKQDTGEERTFTACFFADHRIETERGRDALHSACLWPVLTGRLLMRFLVTLETQPHPEDNDIFTAGVHLWKSAELTFEYPMQVLEARLENDLPRLYGALEGLGNGLGGGGGDAGGEGTVEPPAVFPGLAISLGTPAGGRAADMAGKAEDWHEVPVGEILEKKLDDANWDGARARARADFAEKERTGFGQAEDGTAEYAPQTAFREVDRTPAAIEGELRRVRDGEIPLGTGDVYGEWLGVVRAEEERQAAKKTLRGAAVELEKAQRHYVTPPYGVSAAAAVSAAAGYALFWAFWALGGNAAWPLAAGCAALVAAGAFVGWATITHVHRQAGREALAEFLALAEGVDNAMNSRHLAAVKTVKTAETNHRALLRGEAREALARLLERVKRIVSTELQTPPLDATLRQDGADGEDGGTEGEARTREAREQLETYLRETRWSEEAHGGAAGGDGGGAVGERVEALIQAAAADEGPESFTQFWQDLCRRTDTPREGNLPATVVIPEIRRWMEGLVGKLLDAQQMDFREETAEPGRGRASRLLPRAGAARVDAGDGFTWASAHVDQPEGSYNEKLFYFTKCPEDEHPPIPELTRVTVVPVPGMSGLPQAALYWMDIRLHGFKREKDGRLAFRRQYDGEKQEKAE